jgi:LPXTG-motif cell wall-anchored protein
MRRFLASLLSCSLLLSVAGPAFACANDSEIGKSEREFKSTYNEGPAAGQPVPTTGGSSTGPIALMGAGSFLLVGACAVCLRRGRTP